MAGSVCIETLVLVNTEVAVMVLHILLVAQSDIFFPSRLSDGILRSGTECEI